MYGFLIDLMQDVEVDVPNIPHAPKKGTHKILLNPKELFIEAADFREVSVLFAHEKKNQYCIAIPVHCIAIPVQCTSCQGIVNVHLLGK